MSGQAEPHHFLRKRQPQAVRYQAANHFAGRQDRAASQLHATHIGQIEQHEKCRRNRMAGQQLDDLAAG